ncbi:lymphocyte-specific protein 1-like isoform X2 [Myxocyprinus asiaticus]|uniref:lymphocyte-specific protein 1-like isoform X2 n=1 Tax=Myxocyprinus asiaticus TaxID=70543 RepID=UPI002223D28E|nr:lymphocyte-specific protein 1-like isoform X2 [Myxocyprinus asiaticus]
MSSSILRRHSSKLGLQKLQKITAQRSLEDAEEIEREHRRRARASTSSEPPTPTVTPQDSPRTAQTLNNQGQNNLVPSCPSSLEEDEGFSDWAQHLSRRKQRKLEHDDVEPHLNGSHHSTKQLQLCSSSAQQIKLQQSDLNMYDTTPSIQTRSPLSNQQNLVEDDDIEDWDAREWERRNNIKATEKEERESRPWCEEDETPGRVKENQRCDMNDEVWEKKAEMKISFTSKLLLQQNGRQNSINGQEGKRINQCVSEDVCVKSSEENQQHRDTEDQTHEEVQRRMREEERERKRRDVMEKLKRLSISSADPEEPFSPLSPKSPSYMITERTESLNRSVKKRNSIKTTQSPTIISKLDDRLEQYNHAVEECCKEGNIVKQPLIDVTTSQEPVSARKTLFEAGEAWNQNSATATPSKDTEGLKVGVTDLINQWVKGNPDVSFKSPNSKAASPEVKAGEVRNIKSMWENLGDTSQDKSCVKGSAGKRYKFVESGHGKYEKVLVNDETN